MITMHSHLPPALPSRPLTLQLLVPSFPLKADGGCPFVDEALEAGVLALLHSAAGRVDGDDRATKAWGTRGAEGWAQWTGLAQPLPQFRSPPPSQAHGICHTHGRRSLHWVAQ